MCNGGIILSYSLTHGKDTDVVAAKLSETMEKVTVAQYILPYPEH